MDFRETSLIQGLNSYWYPIDSEFHYRSDIIFCYIFRISLESDLTRSILIKRKHSRISLISSILRIDGVHPQKYMVCTFCPQDTLRYHSDDRKNLLLRADPSFLRMTNWNTLEFPFSGIRYIFVFEFIKNRCQCKLAVGTLLSTKGNMDIEMMGHKYDDMNKTHKYNSVSLTSLSTTA